MNKKKLVGCIFGALFLCTIIVTAVDAGNAYQYEIQNDDIMEGLGAAMVAIAGGFLAFYELDLFCTVNYFLFKPKSKPKTILCVLSNLCLALIIVYTYFSEISEPVIMALRKYELTPLILFILYIVFRTGYALVPVHEADKE